MSNKVLKFELESMMDKNVRTEVPRLIYLLQIKCAHVIYIVHGFICIHICGMTTIYKAHSFLIESVDSTP